MCNLLLLDETDRLYRHRLGGFRRSQSQSVQPGLSPIDDDDDDDHDDGSG